MVSKSAYAPESPSRAGTLDLIAGALALDFANTASGRGGPQHLEHLREPAHVLIWAEHAGVIDAPSGMSDAAPSIDAPTGNPNNPSNDDGCNVGANASWLALVGIAALVLLRRRR